jgi:hypothetical protein
MKLDPSRLPIALRERARHLGGLEVTGASGEERAGGTLLERDTNLSAQTSPDE